MVGIEAFENKAVVAWIVVLEIVTAEMDEAFKVPHELRTLFTVRADAERVVETLAARMFMKAVTYPLVTFIDVALTLRAFRYDEDVLETLMLEAVTLMREAALDVRHVD